MSVFDRVRHLRNRSTCPNEVGLVYHALAKMNRLSTSSSSVMLDVGAHHGASLALFLEHNWEVHAFEPDHKNRQILERRFGNNHNLRVDPRAVSNEAVDAVPFYRSTQSSGISGLSSFHPTHAEEGTVETIPLSTYLQGKDIGHVDFLKIDAEGHDLLVLQGFPWETHHPLFVVCEFEDSKTTKHGYDFHDIAECLSSKNYSVFVSEWHPIKEYGKEHRWNTFHRYPCKLQDPSSWGNLIATRTPEASRVIQKLLFRFRAKNYVTKMLSMF